MFALPRRNLYLFVHLELSLFMVECAVEVKTVKTEELPIQIRRAGEGPLVLLIHGFPDLSLAWHHQIEALAAAGYHAVAPDMRGYGGTGGPSQAEAYSIFSMVGDLVALV